MIIASNVTKNNICEVRLADFESVTQMVNEYCIVIMLFTTLQKIKIKNR